MGLDGVLDQTGDSPPITILYVDDDPDLLTIGRRFLERLGPYRVDCAQSAGEALERLTRSPVDLVLSDYQMPDMDGITFLKAVRSCYGDLPFILFTGRGREEVVIEALNSGADFYLQKGGDPRSQFVELDYTIRQAVTRRRAVQQASSLDRLYSLISRISTVAFKERTPEDLLQECCNIAVEVGMFASAWVGRVEGDSKAVVPVAYAAGRDPSDRGPPPDPLRWEPELLEICRRATETGSPQVCRPGTGSLAGVFPLIVDGRDAGLFVVCVEGSPGFTKEVFTLLGRIASGISIALERLNQASEHARLLDALAESRVRFWLIADQSDLAYMSLDSAGRVREVNRASVALLGRTPDLVVGEPFARYVDPACHSQLSALFAGVRSSGTISRTRLRLYRGDLSQIEVEVTGEASFGQDGCILGFHCLLHPTQSAAAVRVDPTRTRTAPRALLSGQETEKRACDRQHIASSHRSPTFGF